jgi:hypothetical protein
VCLLASIACHESTSRQEQATSSTDAAVDAGRDSADDAQDTEQPIKTIELEPVPPDEAELWQNATEFELDFRADACLGPGCFRYETTSNQSVTCTSPGSETWRDQARTRWLCLRVTMALYTQLLELRSSGANRALHHACGWLFSRYYSIRGKY